MTRSVRWYLHRLGQMSPEEVAWRAADQARHLVWSRRQVHPGDTPGLPAGLRDPREFPTTIPAGTRDLVPAQAGAATIAAAERLLAGEWTLLGVARPDIADPDWFLDVVTGRRAPQERLASRIDHRDEAVTGNVKSVWELSRHHHLTVLAAAWWLTGEDRYAEVVDGQLRSWWQHNPFLSGVHWTSGIELGVRLTSWVWVRRLLDDWPKVADLFDSNEDARRQIWWHQRFLDAFPSRGSSANNHAVAEASGQLVAACAFPWYPQSATWRARASRRLERELRANTFESGVNRELATDYHRFVTELGLVAAAEAGAAGHPLDPGTWALLAASLDAAAAMVDVKGGPPRQGDGDEGRALLVDAPDAGPWDVMLGLGASLVGRRTWWPGTEPSLTGSLLAAIAPSPPPIGARPDQPPRAFPDAGMYLLRTPPADGPEIWCRCDGGPHGFLSIAAHAHADALSIEVRYDGVEVLVDPGTYCYHGESEWRSYFRSTRAHNTIEIDGQDQSVQAGPFMWRSHAPVEVLETDVRSADVQYWSAQHRGYTRLDPTLRHRRTVTLDSRDRRLTVVDTVTAGRRHDGRMYFHLGPDVSVDLRSSDVATLRWTTRAREVEVQLHLPVQLSWTAHRGGTDPVIGWYSPRFGERVPTTTLVGEGALGSITELRAWVAFPDRVRRTARHG